MGDDVLQAVLFDLDDTLLVNDSHTFMRGYFGLLRQHVPLSFEPDDFVQEVLRCTKVMMASTDTAVSNYDTFWSAFSQQSDDAATVETYLDQFYLEQFPKLQSLTSSYPQTADFVKACFEAGLQVVIATNPVYPLQAIEERLLWAGVPVTAFPYALVTAQETMHSTKPHCAYYEEILDKIGCAPEQALMVGDSWENDMLPAAELGMFTYWVALAQEIPPNADLITAYGSFDQFGQWMTATWLE